MDEVLVECHSQKFYYLKSASLSTRTYTLGWFFRTVHGIFSVISSPSTKLLIACCLASPNANKIICLARMMSFIPIVTACFGTRVISLLKNLEFASIVSCFKSTTWTPFSKGVPGSLNPICPFDPTPRICTSMSALFNCSW